MLRPRMLSGVLSHAHARLVVLMDRLCLLLLVPKLLEQLTQKQHLEGDVREPDVLGFCSRRRHSPLLPRRLGYGFIPQHSCIPRHIFAFFRIASMIRVNNRAQSYSVSPVLESVADSPLHIAHHSFRGLPVLLAERAQVARHVGDAEREI